MKIKIIESLNLYKDENLTISELSNIKGGSDICYCYGESVGYSTPTCPKCRIKIACVDKER